MANFGLLKSVDIPLLVGLSTSSLVITAELLVSLPAADMVSTLPMLRLLSTFALPSQ